ncbi:MAG: hypothetical protein ACXW4H_02880 [Candidatus Limnocylindrales bacterium]
MRAFTFAAVAVFALPALAPSSSDVPVPAAAHVAQPSPSVAEPSGAVAEGRTGHASGCHLHYGLFSPLETATFGIDPQVANHMLLPLQEIARVDPMLVLPARPPPSTGPSIPPIALDPHGIAPDDGMD